MTSRRSPRWLTMLCALAVALAMVGGLWAVPARAAEAPDTVRIIGVGVNCLDVPYNNRANGTDLWMYDCNSTPAQSWSYSYANGNIRLLGTNKCLDIEGPLPGNGVPVQIWDCQNVPQHRWSITALGQIKTFDGRCLDVRGAGTANKTRVQVWACTNPHVQAQKWQPNAADRIFVDCGAYYSRVMIDYASSDGQRILIYRLEPRTAALFAISNPFNRDNLWSEFVNCVGANFGHRLPSDDDGINAEFLENQLYCHAVASAFGGRAARDVIGPTWDLENEDINTVDFCNDIPIPN